MADPLAVQASAIVREFVGELKPTLKGAMQTGGPARAVEVCAEQAPAIASRLSDSSGWQVHRVSLKPRNPGATPDEFERRVLQSFTERRKQGVAPAGLNHGQQLNGQYRYLQAQVAEALCLVCHGRQVDPGLRDVIQRYYPADTATGYDAGEVRGAISLTLDITSADSDQ